MNKRQKKKQLTMRRKKRMKIINRAIQKGYRNKFYDNRILLGSLSLSAIPALVHARTIVGRTILEEKTKQFKEDIYAKI